jgi:hypothetical protein
MTAAISRSVELPPLLAYPERRRPVQGPLERAGIAVAAALRAQSTRGRASRLAPILAATERYAETVDGMSDAALRSAAREAGAALRVDVGQAADTVARVLAPVCEAAFRVLG